MSAESLRLGHFLDGKGDFERLNQEASDDETTTTTLSVAGDDATKNRSDSVDMNHIPA